MSFIESTEDMAWLCEVHGAPRGYAVAILYGNEDNPEKVELFARDHYQCKPTIMRQGPRGGRLRVVEHGEKPAKKSS